MIVNLKRNSLELSLNSQESFCNNCFWNVLFFYNIISIWPLKSNVRLSTKKMKSIFCNPCFKSYHLKNSFHKNIHQMLFPK